MTDQAHPVSPHNRYAIDAAYRWCLRTLGDARTSVERAVADLRLRA